MSKSSTTTNTVNEHVSASLTPPGAVLKEEFLEPLGITAYKLSKATGIPQSSIGKLINGHLRFTPESSAKVGAALGLSPAYWFKLQTAYLMKTTKVDVSQIPRLVA